MTHISQSGFSSGEMKATMKSNHTYLSAKVSVEFARSTAGSPKVFDKLRKDAEEGGDGIDTLLFDNSGFTSNFNKQKGHLNSVHELLNLDADHLHLI